MKNSKVKNIEILCAIFLMAEVCFGICNAQCIDPRYQRSINWISHDKAAARFLGLDTLVAGVDFTVADTLICPTDVPASDREINSWADSLPESVRGSGWQLTIPCSSKICACLVMLSTSLNRRYVIYFSEIDEAFLGHSALVAEIYNNEEMLDSYAKVRAMLYGPLTYLLIFDRKNQVVRAWSDDLRE